MVDASTVAQGSFGVLIFCESTNGSLGSDLPLVLLSSLCSMKHKETNVVGVKQELGLAGYLGYSLDNRPRKREKHPYGARPMAGIQNISLKNTADSYS